jgi:hypothetical protein
MNAHGGADVYIHVFSTSALVEGERSASSPGRFTPSTQWKVGWVGPRTGLDEVEKRKILPLPGLKLRPLCRSHCQSLYRLRYPGSYYT